MIDFAKVIISIGNFITKVSIFDYSNVVRIEYFANGCNIDFWPVVFYSQAANFKKYFARDDKGVIFRLSQIFHED